MSSFEISLYKPLKDNIIKSNNVEIFEVGKFKNYFILYLPFSRKLLVLDKNEYDSYKACNYKILDHDFIKPIFPPIEFTNNIFIILTEKCNFHCIYCFADVGQIKEKIKIKNAVEIIEEISNKFKFSKLNIYFFGGEPTLSFSEIKKIITGIRKKRIDFNLAIQTNGFFSDTVRKFLYNNFYKISISCDGPPEIQNDQRKLKGGGDTSEKVEDNINFFIKNKKPIGISSVITKDSIKKQSKIIEYFNELGIKKLSFGLVKEEGRAKNFSFNEIFLQTDQLVREFFKAFELSEEYEMILRSDMLPMTDISNIYCNASSPQFFIYPNGSIFSCPTFHGEFYFGRYDKSKNDIVLFENKIKNLQKRRVENIFVCNKCFLKWQCAGACSADALRENASMFNPYNKFCILQKKMMKKYFDYKILKYFNASISQIFEINKKLFLKTIFNEFKLKRVHPEMKFIDNPWIIIDKDFDLKRLLNKILKYRKDRLHNSTLFLLTFNSGYNSLLEKKFMNLIKNLREKRVYFKVTKPLSRHKDSNLPKNCFECLELFTIKNKKVIFCNGMTSKYDTNKIFSRKQIYEEFVSKRNNLQTKCRISNYTGKI